MKPTIRDVAKMANVSVSTVSRVINGKGYVHKETEIAINEAIAKLGFVPNQLARSLTSRASKMIGVIVPHMGPFFYGELLEGIESQATTYGYKTVFCYTKDDPARELEYLSFFGQYNIEGLIIASDFHQIEALRNLTIPIVTVDHAIALENIPSITSNNLEGGRLAANYFISKNHQNILLLRGPSFLLTTIERTQGFMEEIEKSKAKVHVYDLDLINPDTRLIESIIKSHPKLDAVFCYSDIIGLATISVLKRLNYDIPGQVSVIGYDNAPFTRWSSPSLSTIEQPIHLMGKKAFNQLLAVIEKNEDENNDEVLDVKLILRHSTK